MPEVKPSEKPVHLKTANEMNFHEFVDWATSHVMFGIVRGESLRSLVYAIIGEACRNEVFGGLKKPEKKPKKRKK